MGVRVLPFVKTTVQKREARGTETVCSCQAGKPARLKLGCTFSLAAASWLQLQLGCISSRNMAAASASASTAVLKMDAHYSFFERMRLIS